MAAKPRLLIDLTPACRPLRSGVGFALAELVKAVDEYSPFHETYDVVGFTTSDCMNRARDLHLKNIKLRTLPFLHYRIKQGLYKLRLMPPVDWFLGPGTYLCYDFTLLPLTKHSQGIVCVHDLTYLRFPELVEAKNLAFLRRFVSASVQKATKVMVVSQAIRQEIAVSFGLSLDKIFVCYPTADKLFYRRDRQEIAEVITKYSLPDRPYFVVLGNQDPRKNLAVLLDAYRQLGDPKDIPPLVMFGAMAWGSGTVANQLHELRQSGYNIVTPAQYITDDDLPRVISGALAMVTPSLYEGFSFPPLQAVLCQTPAIVADNLPVNEIIGDYTVKVSPTDVDQLRRALHNISTAGYHAVQVDRAAILDKVGPAAVAKTLLKALRTGE